MQRSNSQNDAIMRFRLAACALALLLGAGCAEMPVGTMNVAPLAKVPAEEPPQAAVPVITTESTAAPVAVEAAAKPVTPVPAASPAPPAPPPPVNLWNRVRGGFQLSNLEGQLVQDWEKWYSTRPDYVARMIDRSSRFLYHVMEEIDRRKMPAEIALLPMIESAYNPQAYSRAHASGMWQFIPSTGKNYGLNQNFWYDGRRHPIAATSAALDYLEKLYGMFGNWELALAAYNWGEGAVSRAIARNQAKGLPTDYESVTMPPETRNYLPKLQAVKNIIASPQSYNLTLAEVPNEPYFATVTTSRHIDVNLAARFAEVPLEDFKFLNPAHNKPVIKAHGSETILLPRDKVAVFERNLRAHDKPLVSWQAYTVKRSDKPEGIAARYGMSVTELKEVNRIPPAKKIVAGQTLMVPVKGNVEPNLPDLPAPKVTPVRSAKAKGTQTTRARMAVAKGTHQPVRKPAAKSTGTHVKKTKTTAEASKQVVVAGSK
jgi:membrane-bound lytic murein transglycosylase D